MFVNGQDVFNKISDLCVLQRQSKRQAASRETDTEIQSVNKPCQEFTTKEIENYMNDENSSDK